MRISDWSSDVCSSDLRDHSRRKRWNIPPQRLHIQIVRHQQPIEPNATADDVADDCWGQTAWQIPVPCGVNNMRGHSHRRVIERPEWRHIDFQLRFIRIHRSEEHTSELQSLMRNSYAVFCLKKKTNS